MSRKVDQAATDAKELVKNAGEKIEEKVSYSNYFAHWLTTCTSHAYENNKKLIPIKPRPRSKTTGFM